MSSITPQACMGGWCTIRQHCPHHLTANRSNPVERLCANGHDGLTFDELGHAQQVDMVMPVEFWRRRAEACQRLPARAHLTEAA